MAGRTDEQQQAGTHVSIGSDRRREGKGGYEKRDVDDSQREGEGWI